MENQNIKIFNYEDKQVRTIEKDGEIWFVSMDIAEITGHRNIRASGNRYLDDDEVAICYIADKQGRQNQTQIVNESGFYKYMFRSKLQPAKMFTKFVTSVILPTIRKTGSYNTASPLLAEIAKDKQVIQILTEQKNAINKRLRFLKMRVEENENIVYSPYKATYSENIKPEKYEQMSLDLKTT